MGKNWQVSVRGLINDLSSSNNKQINDRNYFDLIQEQIEDYEYRHEASEWIYNLFAYNELTFVDFIAQFLTVKRKALPKRNSLVLCGPPNCNNNNLYCNPSHFSCIQVKIHI